MFDFSSIFPEGADMPWFDMEFLASEDLGKFYSEWKAKKNREKEDAKISAEIDKRRKLYEELKKEFKD